VSNKAFFASAGFMVYAYISGELTTVETSVTDLGKTFQYALGELTKEVSKLPVETSVPNLLSCAAVGSDEIEAVNKKIAIDGEIEIVETADIKAFAPLMSAVRDPGRFIPLETKDRVRELTDFINKYDLYGTRADFILPNTRGTFRCILKNVYAPAVVKPKQEKPYSYSDIPVLDE